MYYMNKDINDILESFDLILNENKSLLNEAATSSTSLLGGSKVKIPADGGHSSQSGWQSGNAWDIAAAPNTPVYAIAAGKVISFNNYGANVTETEGKRLYGYAFTVDSDNNLPDVFYTHLTTVSVKQGDNIQCGQFLGYVMKSPKSVNYDHVHIGVESGHKINEFLNSNGTLKCGVSNTLFPQSSQEDDDDIFGINNLDPNDETVIATKNIYNSIKQMGLKEEKVYSKLGDKVLNKSDYIVIPSSSNNKIKSPISGIINNYRPDRSCNNQITIEHSMEGEKTYYLNFCGISNPEVRNGNKVSKGDILGTTSSDVTVSIYDKLWKRLNLPKHMDNEISTNIDPNNNNNNLKKDQEYYDAFYPWIGKKILGLGKKIKDKIPSTTKGGEPKIKNFFTKHGMTSKKVDENIKRIKGLL